MIRENLYHYFISISFVLLFPLSPNNQ